MKRLISMLLVFAAVLLMLVSCSDGNRSYDEDEVAAAAELLIRKSEKLNEIYWGTGIGYSESDSNGFYYSARADELQRLGIASIDDLKRQTLATFTIGYSESIFSTLLSPLGDEDTGIVGYTRYFQQNDKIMVFSKFEPLLTDEVSYLYDTVAVTHSEGETVYVEITVRIKRGDKLQERAISVGFVEEDGEWKIDTPTYATYREE